MCCRVHVAQRLAPSNSETNVALIMAVEMRRSATESELHALQADTNLTGPDVIKNLFVIWG